MDLYINGEKISAETVEKYHLKPGMAFPFSIGVITSSPSKKGKIQIEALKESKKGE